MPQTRRLPSSLRHFTPLRLVAAMTAPIVLAAASLVAMPAAAADKSECIAPAKPGGGYDLTCRLAANGLLETGHHRLADDGHLHARWHRCGRLQPRHRGAQR